ncbi:MAG: hypothetical protein RTV72_00020 [Candidatus Thorarchaeota archaeon]
MKSAKGNRILVLLLSAILILSVLSIISPDVSTDLSYREIPFPRETFTVATNYTPGEYPSGLTLFDGDVLNATSGGTYNVTGNFTIVSGATVNVVAGYKIGVYADNIIIAGTLDANGAGYSGGAGGATHSDGYHGQCDPESGGGRGGPAYQYGGGGGAYGNNGLPGSSGGAGGQEYGTVDFELPIPLFSDIRMGAGGGGGHGGYTVIGGAGGYGGGAVILEARDDILINGSILCNGAPGESVADTDFLYGAGGGGGGAGGGVLLFGDRVVVSGELSAKGGARGYGGDGAEFDGYPGGAGSGGRIKIAYLTFLNTSGSSISVIGGYASTPLGTIHMLQTDIIPPTITLISPTNSSVHAVPTTIHVNASDLFSIQQVQHRWDYSSYNAIPLNTTLYTLITTIPQVDGRHVLDILAQDFRNNWNHEIFTFTYDAYDPTIVSLFPDNNTIHKSESILSFAVSDTIGLNEVLYNWDDGDNETFSEPYELLLPSGEGLHNLTIYAQDTADHWTTAIYSFETDDAVPTVSLPDDITYTEGQIGHEIIWTLTDLHPHSYVITANNIPIDSGPWTSGIGIALIVDGQIPGVYVYTIIAVDEAGNQITDSVIVTVLEVTTSITTTTTATSTNMTTGSTAPAPPFHLLNYTLSVLAIGGVAGGIIVLFVLFYMKHRS